jgi:hypothetical protein
MKNNYGYPTPANFVHFAILRNLSSLLFSQESKKCERISEDRNKFKQKLFIFITNIHLLKTALT